MKDVQRRGYGGIVSSVVYIYRRDWGVERGSDDIGDQTKYRQLSRLVITGIPHKQILPVNDLMNTNYESTDLLFAFRDKNWRPSKTRSVPLLFLFFFFGVYFVYVFILPFLLHFYKNPETNS